MSKKLKTVGYIHIKKENNTDNIEPLVGEMTGFISANENWQYAGVLFDDRTGHKIEDRPSFLRLMKMVESNSIDNIVVRSPETISSNDIALYKTIRKIQEKGVRIYVADYETYYPYLLGSDGEKLGVAMSIYMLEQKRKVEKEYKELVKRNPEAAENLYHHLYYDVNYKMQESISTLDDKIIEIKVGKYHAKLALTSTTWEALTDAMKKISDEV